MATEEEKKQTEGAVERVEKKVSEFTQNIDEKIAKEIDQEVEEVGAEELRELIRKRIDQKLEAQERSPIGGAATIGRMFTEFRQKFTVCWKGPCKIVLLVMIISYAAAALAGWWCSYRDGGLCIEKSISGSVGYLALIMVIALSASFFLSTLSKEQQEPVVFGFILIIPIALFILIAAFKYVAVILLAIVIFTYFFRGRRSF